MRIIDWSSDVCFSDLSFRASTRRPGGHLGVGECARTLIIPGVATPAQLIPGVVGVAPALRGTGGEQAVESGLERPRQIGGASCKETVCTYRSISVGAVALKKTQHSR